MITENDDLTQQEREMIARWEENKTRSTPRQRGNIHNSFNHGGARTRPTLETTQCQT